MSCYCGTGVNLRKNIHLRSSPLLIQTRDITKLMFKPAFIETCALTFFKRAWFNSEMSVQDEKCSSFQDKLKTVREVPVPLSLNSNEMGDILTQFNQMMAKERHAVPLHEDKAFDLKSCFKKYGISHQSLAYCLHITTSAKSKKKRRSSEEEKEK